MNFNSSENVALNNPMTPTTNPTKLIPTLVLTRVPAENNKNRKHKKLIIGNHLIFFLMCFFDASRALETHRGFVRNDCTRLGSRARDRTPNGQAWYGVSSLAFRRVSCALRKIDYV